MLEPTSLPSLTGRASPPRAASNTTPATGPSAGARGSSSRSTVHNTSEPSSTVAIALAKLPATVAPSAASFRGAVFAQPGGPSESGTLYLRGNGRKLRDVVDVPGRQHHDLVAFDPRGTGHSAPRLDCFPGLLGHVRAQERDVTEAVDVSRAALARDVLAILDKIEEEEERQRDEEPVSVEHDESRLELREESRKEKGKARLQFIGISYGAFLGSAFASLFPDRVGRMVLDGVVNPLGYQDVRISRLSKDTPALLSCSFLLVY